jgi:hypothetical protein
MVGVYLKMNSIHFLGDSKECDSFDFYSNEENRKRNQEEYSPVQKIVGLEDEEDNSESDDEEVSDEDGDDSAMRRSG